MTHIEASRMINPTEDKVTIYETYIINKTDYSFLTVLVTNSGLAEELDSVAMTVNIKIAADYIFQYCDS